MNAIIDTVDLKPILKALLDEISCRDNKMQALFQWMIKEYGFDSKESVLD